MLLSAAALALLSAPQSGSAGIGPWVTAGVEDLAPDPGPELWPEWLARDRRVGFNDRSFEQGRAELAREGPDAIGGLERAVALIAVGSSRSRAARALIEPELGAGDELVRSAACLALGETGPGGEALLAERVADPELGPYALLALARTGEASSRALVQQVAADPAQLHSGVASDVLAFLGDPAQSRPTPALVRLLDLRWKAARVHGLVDGQAWRVILAFELLDDPGFRSATVLRAASIIGKQGAKDLVLSELCEGEGDERLRAAVRCMPAELAELVRTGLWLPATPDEWSVILTEIERSGTWVEAIDLLLAAREIPRVRYRAMALLARAGEPSALDDLESELADLDPLQRAQACEAMAESGSRSWLGRLEDLRQDRSPFVRASALVGEVRLGSERAHDELQELLQDKAHADRAAVVRAMCRGARDVRIAAALEAMLGKAEGEEADRIATALADQSWKSGQALLRKALRARPPRGELGADMIRALGRQVDPADLEILTSHYPRENDLEVNIAIAVALIEQHSPYLMHVLRSAIWSESWNRSLLAAGLLVELTGIRALEDEIDRAPPEASSGDLRRVGFAIGEWGGVGAVERVARARHYNSGDPAVQGAYLGALGARTQ